MSHRTRRAARATAVAVAVALSISAAANSAESTTNIDLPAQPLAQAIQVIARQASINILVDPRLIAGRDAPAMKAQMSIEQALNLLLQGTGLTPKYVDDKTITLVAVNVPVKTSAYTSSAADTIRLAQADTPSPSQGDGGNQSKEGKTSVEDQEAPAQSQKRTERQPIQEEIVVTGTHIRGAAPSSPVVTVTQEDMRLSGHTNLGEAMRALPQNFAGGQNPEVGFGASGDGANQNISGGSSLNLRGLGPNATLTLLNGARLPYDGVYQATDISVIPVAAIERVEFLLDGASAIYGSDAVGGVANVVLKRDYKGAEISARYGAATEGGYEQQQYTGVVGDVWASGGFLLTGDFSRNSPIRARDRDYLGYVPNQDVFIYPASEQMSALLSAHQHLTEAIEFKADVIYSKREQEQDLQTTNILLDDRDAETWGFSPSLGIQLPGDWSMDIRGFIGDNNVEFGQVFLNIADGAFLREAEGVIENSAQMFSVEGEGPIFEVAGGEARLAIGAGYRNNELKFDNRFSDLTDVNEDRASKFAYAEATAPLLSGLLLNGAVRYEDYDDFGSVTTPKVGITWTVVPDLNLKMSWGKSFKTPTLVDQYLPTFVTLFPSVFFGDPNAPASSAVIILNGGNPDLGPERAETIAVGFEFVPQALPGLQIELNWFQIDYNDRIVSPLTEAFFTATTDPIYAQFVTFNPTLAQQQSAFALGGLPFGQFSVDLTGGAYEPSAVYAIENGVNANASSQEASGFDLTVRYDTVIAGAALSLTGNANWLQGTRKLTALAPERDTTGRIYYPAEFKARAGAVWSRDGFSVSSHVNYTDGVANIYFPSNPETTSWTTVDMAIDYQSIFALIGDVGLTLTISNLLDERPPVLQPQAAYLVNYDVTNYSAVGRVISATLTKRF